MICILNYHTSQTVILTKILKLFFNMNYSFLNKDVWSVSVYMFVYIWECWCEGVWVLVCERKCVYVRVSCVFVERGGDYFYIIRKKFISVFYQYSSSVFLKCCTKTLFGVLYGQFITLIQTFSVLSFHLCRKTFTNELWIVINEKYSEFRYK